MAYWTAQWVSDWRSLVRIPVWVHCIILVSVDSHYEGLVTPFMTRREHYCIISRKESCVSLGKFVFDSGVRRQVKLEGGDGVRRRMGPGAGQSQGSLGVGLEAGGPSE